MTEGPNDRDDGADDLRLWQRAAAGDEDALARLIVLTRNSARRKFIGWAYAHADEMVESLLHMLAAALRGARTGPEVNLNGYLDNLCRAAQTEFLRDRSKVQRLAGPDVEDVGVTDPTTESPDQAAMRDELQRAVTACLERIRPAHRDAVVRYLQGHRAVDSERERATTFRSWVKRGLDSLRACLQAKGFDGRTA